MVTLAIAAWARRRPPPRIPFVHIFTTGLGPALRQRHGLDDPRRHVVLRAWPRSPPTRACSSPSRATAG
jgi:hypothetical protein